MKTESVKKEKLNAKGKSLSNAMKIWIAIGVIFVFAGLCVLLQAGNVATVTLEAGFAQVSEGENPDGSPFNINEVLSDEVLEKAIVKLGENITVEELRTHLTVSDSSDKKTVEKVKNSIIDGNESYTAFPNVYLLKYATVSEHIQSKGVFDAIGAFFKQFAMPSKGKILTAVSESYVEYYTDKYIVTADAIAVDWTEGDQLDYYNKSLYARDVIGKLSRFLQTKYLSNVTFVAENGSGYGDLSKELSMILDTDVENYKAYVVKNGLTYNLQALLGQFNYMKTKKLDIQQRKTEEYEINKQAIKKYDPNVTKVVFIPSLDTSENFYMNRTKVGMDYLIEGANAAKLTADDARTSVVNYDYLITAFNGTTAVEGERNTVADELYEIVKFKVNAVAEKAQELVSQDIADDFEQIEAGKVEHGFNLTAMILSGGKLFVFLLLLAFVLFNLYSAVSKKIKEA